MKDLSFVSNVNGLQVTAPADVYPAPNCSDTMCPIQEQAEAFPCTPQLDPLSPMPLMFPVEVAAEDESYVGAVYTLDDGWAIGNGPDGVPTGVQSFNMGSDESGFTIFYNDTDGRYDSVAATVYDNEGNTVASGDLLYIYGVWRLSINDPGFPMLEEGATYCVQITITNGGGPA